MDSASQLQFLQNETIIVRYTLSETIALDAAGNELSSCKFSLGWYNIDQCLRS